MGLILALTPPFQPQLQGSEGVGRVRLRERAHLICGAFLGEGIELRVKGRREVEVGTFDGAAVEHGHVAEHGALEQRPARERPRERASPPRLSLQRRLHTAGDSQPLPSGTWLWRRPAFLQGL